MNKIINKILGSIGIGLWIVGASLMDSDPMIIPVVMVVVGLLFMTISYRKGLKNNG